jgi:putative colanic acid biosynthesis UDP-glucose lipid carrier transferase
MVDLGRNTGLESFEPLAAPGAMDYPNVAFSRSKRALDVIAALLLLLFVLPLLIVVAICVVIDSRGPIFFVQRRTGYGGVPIRVYKFRTMTVMEDGDAIRHAGRNDQRVTRIGRFLRRSSIDELPQLANVIKGDMSLVGPRPHALAHDQYYGALVTHYTHRFRAKPGITGLAQVNGLRGEIHSLEGMVDRVAQDNAYIDDWSLGLDVKILMKTAAVAAFQSSAY